jgi:hypothetical protein
LLNAAGESNDRILGCGGCYGDQDFVHKRHGTKSLLALDHSEGSRRVGKVHGTDLGGEITKIARVKGHGYLNIEVGEL